MQGEARRAAKAAYKARKPVAGIFAVRCLGTGQVWVGQGLNVETEQNRLWFALRAGSESHRDLQDAWRRHGADAFSFEVLERLEDEELPYVRQALLKDRVAHWRGELAAGAV